MIFDIHDLYLPEFGPYTRKANDANCKELDVRRIIGEILGGQNLPKNEISDSFNGDKVLIEGNYSIVLRYKRESNNKTYPVVVMGFDIDDNSNVIIRHIQGVRQNRSSYRFGAGFDSFGYFLELIQQNFTQKGIKVFLPNVPTHLEATSTTAKSPKKYEELKRTLDNFNKSI